MTRTPAIERPTKVPSTLANNLRVLFCLCVSGAAFGESGGVCELAVKRGGLVQYAVQVEPDQQGYRTIKADIDLDGSPDALRWFDPVSASLIAADNATVTLTLTSNGHNFTLEQQRFFVAKFESRYYAISTQVESVLGPWLRDVFAISQKGFTRVCSLAGKGQSP